MRREISLEEKSFSSRFVFNKPEISPQIQKPTKYCSSYQYVNFPNTSHPLVYNELTTHFSKLIKRQRVMGLFCKKKL